MKLKLNVNPLTCSFLLPNLYEQILIHSNIPSLLQYHGKWLSSYESLVSKERMKKIISKKCIDAHDTLLNATQFSQIM